MRRLGRPAEDHRRLAGMETRHPSGETVAEDAFLLRQRVRHKRHAVPGRRPPGEWHTLRGGGLFLPRYDEDASRGQHEEQIGEQSFPFAVHGANKRSRTRYFPLVGISIGTLTAGLDARSRMRAE